MEFPGSGPARGTLCSSSGRRGSRKLAVPQERPSGTSGGALRGRITRALRTPGRTPRCARRGQTLLRTGPVRGHARLAAGFLCADRHASGGQKSPGRGPLRLGAAPHGDGAPRPLPGLAGVVYPPRVEVGSSAPTYPAERGRCFERHAGPTKVPDALRSAAPGSRRAGSGVSARGSGGLRNAGRLDPGPGSPGDPAPR